MFKQCNRLLRWCPSADCTNAVKVQYVEARQVKCKCNHIFCFECGENWHDPVKCRLLKKWIKKCDDDSETSNWIAANTKECPKCNVTIEKDGGCNHMVNYLIIAHFIDYLIVFVVFRSVKIQIVNMISVGFVWVHGNLMVLHGTIVIVTMRMRLKQHVMLRKN